METLAQVIPLANNLLTDYIMFGIVTNQWLCFHNKKYNNWYLQDTYL